MYLAIPKLLIAVPVEERMFGNGQDILDKENLAVSFHWNKLMVIADHNHQSNFKNLNKAKEGTKAYLIDKKKIEMYVCDSTQVGHITLSPHGNRLYDSEYMPVHLVFDSGLCIYTCIEKSADDIMDVRLTHWRKDERKDRRGDPKTQAVSV